MEGAAMTDATGTRVAAEDWPHGLRCMDCDATIPEGTFYSKRLIAADEHAVVTEIVCVPCGMRLA